MKILAAFALIKETQSIYVYNLKYNSTAVPYTRPIKLKDVKTIAEGNILYDYFYSV
jgi:hypothetical protein